MARVRFGFMLPNCGPCATPENLVTAAKEAESAGFDAICLNDHLISQMKRHLYDFRGIAPPEIAENEADPNVFESLTTLAYLSAITDKVELVTSVLLLPVRNPVILAKQIAVIDNLSKGRVVLGLGVGSDWDSQEFDNLGSGGLFEQRGEAANEYMRAMKALWTEHEPSFEGEYVHFNKLLAYPKPFRKPHPPLIVGGRSRAARRRAASLGDGYFHGLWGADQLPEEISEIRSLRQDLGVGMDGFRFYTQAFVNVNASKDVALSALKYQLLVRGGGLYGGEHKKQFEANSWKGDWRPSNDVEQALAGTPGDIIMRLEEIVKIDGLTDIELMFVHPTMRNCIEQLRTIGREVLPSFD